MIQRPMYRLTGCRSSSLRSLLPGHLATIIIMQRRTHKTTPFPLTLRALPPIRFQHLVALKRCNFLLFLLDSVFNQFSHLQCYTPTYGPARRIFYRNTHPSTGHLFDHPHPSLALLTNDTSVVQRL